VAARQVALDHHRARRRLARAAVVEARRLWRQVDPSQIRRSWLALVTRLTVVVAGAQLAAARQADEYVERVLAEQGIDPEPDGILVPSMLAGVASDGRPLDTLLTQPAISTVTALDQGRSMRDALAAGQATLEMMVRTQVADAGRVADGVALTTRRRASGYVRMVVGATCSRCIILAGKWFRWNQGFQRHPRCLPAGVVVSGPATVAATRRWYQGELVVLTTASGQELPITGNHPVLTDRGWLPAHLVEEGDYVVRSARGQGATPLVVPHEHQVPTRIEDLWRPNGVVPLLKVPTTAEDFHGDGGHGEVDVVLADRLLWDRFEPAGYEFIEQEQLAGGVTQAALLALDGASQQLLLAATRATYGGVGGSSLPAALLRGHAAGAHLAGCGHVADLDSGGYESAPDDVAADAVAEAEAVLALAGRVRRREVGGWQHVLSTRWDPPAGPFTVESRGAYASRGKDLLLRIAGQVELDRVVELRRVEWGGHVYNLTSAEGWYSANGIIVSNCDCVHIPAREDTADSVQTNPKKIFESMTPEEQDRVFTKAGAQAIRDGADMSRVVNARRGMTTAVGPSGRRRLVRDDRGLFTTTEATARRGRLPGQVAGVRLMPESIYQIAGGNRAEAIRLLRLHGYIR